MPIENGGFESPDIATGTWANFGSIPGWAAVNTCGIEVQDHVAGSPAEGGQFVELNANCRGGIAKKIPTTAGTTYKISFAFSPRPNTIEGDNAVQLTWNDEPIITVGPVAGGADTSWKSYTVDVYGNGMDATLRFLYMGANPSGYAIGGYIDNVRVFRVA